MGIKNTKINLDQVCTVNVHPKTKCGYCKYCKEERFLFWVWRREGYFSLKTYLTYSIDSFKENNENLYIEDKVVYFKPHVELIMSNGYMYEKYFNTVQDLEDFMNSTEIQTMKLINIK